VEEGRVTFQRILTYTFRSIIHKVRQVAFLLAGLVLFQTAVLTPLLMVLMMVAGDFFALSSATDNVRPSSVPNVWRVGNLTIAGIISGSTYGITKIGADTLTLSGVNTYTGGTTISAGTLTIGGAGQLGGGSYAGNIANSGTLIYNSSAAQTLSGQISGTGALTQQGAGTLTLSGANNYSGATALSGGAHVGLVVERVGATQARRHVAEACAEVLRHIVGTTTERHELDRRDRVRVDGDMMIRAVRRDDVVVEVADLVLIA